MPDLEGDIFLKVSLESLLHEKSKGNIINIEKMILILKNIVMEVNLFI
jgi:hypothetical protein